MLHQIETRSMNFAPNGHVPYIFVCVLSALMYLFGIVGVYILSAESYSVRLHHLYFKNFSVPVPYV